MNLIVRIFWIVAAVTAGWIPSAFVALVEFVKTWSIIVMLAWYGGKIELEKLKRR